MKPDAFYYKFLPIQMQVCFFAEVLFLEEPLVSSFHLKLYSGWHPTHDCLTVWPDTHNFTFSIFNIYVHHVYCLKSWKVGWCDCIRHMGGPIPYYVMLVTQSDHEIWALYGFSVSIFWKVIEIKTLILHGLRVEKSYIPL